MPWRLDAPPRPTYRLVRADTSATVADRLPNLENVKKIADGQARSTGVEHGVVDEQTGRLEYTATPPERAKEE